MIRWTRGALGFVLLVVAGLFVAGCTSPLEEAATLDSSVSTISLKIEGMT